LASLPHHIARKTSPQQVWGPEDAAEAAELAAQHGEFEADMAELRYLAHTLLDATLWVGLFAPQLLPVDWLNRGLVEYDIDAYVQPWPSDEQIAELLGADLIAEWRNEREAAA